MTVWLIIATLFALAIALLGGARRGRHHVHARLFARPFERRRLTVAELEARLADEAAARRHDALDSRYVALSLADPRIGRLTDRMAEADRELMRLSRSNTALRARARRLAGR